MDACAQIVENVKACCVLCCFFLFRLAEQTQLQLQEQQVIQFSTIVNIPFDGLNRCGHPRLLTGFIMSKCIYYSSLKLIEAMPTAAHPGSRSWRCHKAKNGCCSTKNVSQNEPPWPKLPLHGALLQLPAHLRVVLLFRCKCIGCQTAPPIR
jgi:hypothetical protein